MTDIPKRHSNRDLTITTPGVNYDVPPTQGDVALVSADDFFIVSIEQVLTYARDLGTIKTLTIVGHGVSKNVTSQEYVTNGSQVMGVRQFLDTLKMFQAESGIKIADRIVFSACDVLTQLSPADVQYFRETAKQLGAEIVGATSTGLYTPAKGGHEIALTAAFGSDGSVSRDRTSATGHDLFTLLLREIEPNEWFHPDRTLNRFRTTGVTDLETQSHAEWFACHVGKTQAEGTACQAVHDPAVAGSAAVPKERGESRDLGTIKILGEGRPAEARKDVTVKPTATPTP